MHPSDEEYIKKVAAMTLPDLFTEATQMAKINDTHKLALIMKSGVDTNRALQGAMMTAFIMDHPKTYIFLAENGVIPDKEEFDSRTFKEARARRFCKTLLGLQDAQKDVLKNPEKYSFIKDYSAPILLSGFMKPPYDDTDISMVTWALCAEPVQAVFEKLHGHIKPGDVLKDGMTYRSVVAQLGLRDDYKHFITARRLKTATRNTRRSPLKRAP